MIGLGTRITLSRGQWAILPTDPGPIVGTLPTVDSSIARIGILLTATGGTYLASGGGSVSVVREWLSGGVRSATGLADTPVLADHANSFVYRETATETGGTNPGSVIRQVSLGNVIHVAPVPLGGLADLDLIVGAAMTPLNLAAGFDGLDISLALTSGTSPVGLVFDGTNLSGTPTGVAATTLTFTATNSGGTATSAFMVNVLTAVVSADIQPVMGALIAGSAIDSETGTDGSYSSDFPSETFGAPTVEYRVDGGQWTVSPGTAANGQIIEKRIIATGSAGSTGQFVSAAITVSAGGTIPVQGGAGFDGTNTIDATTSEVPVTVFYMVDDRPTPSGALVAAGGGLLSGSYLVSSMPSSTAVDVSGVSAGNHYLHRVLRNAASNLSNVISVEYGFPGSVPAQMGAPTVAAVDQSSVLVTLASAPAPGSDPIIGYDARWSTDNATWTDVLDVNDPFVVNGFSAATTVYVQTRAENTVGPAATWSTSDSAVTSSTGGAMPSWKASGPGVGSGASLSVAWPAGHSVGDMGVLINEMRGNDATNPTPSGWTFFGSAQSGSGSGDTKVDVYTRVAASANEASASLSNNGNHQSGQIHTIDGAGSVRQLGSDTIGNGSSVTIAGGVTARANSLIMVIVANGTDSTADQISVWTNPELTSVSDRGGAQVINGGGGGFDVVTGEKVAAGTVGETTTTLATASDWAGMVLEFTL